MKPTTTEPTTIKGWLETLPEPARSQAIAHAEEEYSLKYIETAEADSLRGALLAAFTWHLTTEGVDYWNAFTISKPEAIKPKPIGQWLEEDLPTEISKRAISNAHAFTDLEVLEKEVPTLKQAVGAAFSWIDTEEGHDYWEQIAAGKW